MLPATIGLYVHVPFCERVCPYCDFPVLAARPLGRADEQRYVAALIGELEAAAPAYALRQLCSVYLGGGTPSLLAPDSLAQILEGARAVFAGEGAAELEVTLEANPSTLERERLPGFRDAGVNRLSIGIQSFDDEVLRRLGRAHRADEGRATLAAARRAGFANVSLDLIFAAPGGSPDQLDRDLEEIVAFAPEHVSTYELTIEEGTPFALAERRGQLDRPDDDEAARSIDRIEARLAGVGIERYEISSHARTGFESRHNRRYWRREPVLGIGMGAWSNLPPSREAPQGSRRANARSLAAYLERVEKGESPVAETEVLSAAAARGEAVFLGLREMGGLSAAAFQRDFGGPPRRFFGEAIDRLQESGLLEEDGGGDLRLSRRGRLWADEVARHFL